MSNDHRKSIDTGKESLKAGASGKRKKIELSDDDCRCKESKGKTLPGMLKLMVNDLLFWKKERKS